MILQWRGKEYTFTNRVIESSHDSDAPGRSHMAAPIFGADTESVHLPGAYVPICIQLSDKERGESMIWLNDKSDGLGDFLDFLYDHVINYMDRGIKTGLCYFHNLVYDWGQLIKQRPDLIAILKTGIGITDEITLVESKQYHAVLMKGGLFVGKSPFFEIKFIESKRRSFKVMFRDTFSFFPSSLDKIGTQLNLDEIKLPRPDDIGKRDYRREKDKDKKAAFIAYALRDPLVTRLAGEKIRELHQMSGMERVRISAPSYAITKLIQSMPPGMELQTGSDDQNVMQLIVDSYKGGRTGGIYHGKVSNMFVLDIHSSYPASMTTLPSFTPTMEYMRLTDEDEPIDVSEFLRLCKTIPLFARIDGIESDPEYPCIIETRNHKLTPIYGRFENVATTGVEIMVGIGSGTLEVTRVRELVLLMDQDEPEYHAFRDFILNEYGRKESAEPDSPEYVGAKLGMNGSYGKLIESRRQTYIDAENSEILLPYDANNAALWGNTYYAEYVKMQDEGRTDFDDHIEPMIRSFVVAINNDPAGKLDWATLDAIGLTRLKYGRYAIPGAAALITATSRARLLVGMKTLRAKYWDTDSLFVNEYDPIKAQKALDKTRHWLPDFIQPVNIGDRLGDFGIELQAADGWLAGTKRYYLKGFTPKGKPKEKTAIHGIASFDRKRTSEIISSLATGKNFAYKGKGRPTTAKMAKRSEDIGAFVYTDYDNIRFKLDDRLDWVKDRDGWVGKVKNNL